MVLTAIAATAIVLVFFAVDTLRNAPETFAAMSARALAVVLDAVVEARPRRGVSQPDATQDAGLPTPIRAGGSRGRVSDR